MVVLTAIFFAEAGVPVDGGFGGALVQEEDTDDLDFNSVFYLNLVLSLVMYVDGGGGLTTAEMVKYTVSDDGKNGHL